MGKTQASGYDVSNNNLAIGRKGRAGYCRKETVKVLFFIYNTIRTKQLEAQDLLLSAGKREDIWNRYS